MKNTREDAASLQTVLAQVDQDAAPFLGRDMEIFRGRALKDLRKKKPHVTFILGAYEMALAVNVIQEIGNMPTVTRLPNLPDWIRGIVQVRGEILSVVDFRRLFDMGRGASLSPQQPFLLFNVHGFKFCLPVDRVSGVLGLDEQRDALIPFSNVDSSTADGIGAYVLGVLTQGERAVHVLSHERLAESPALRQWQRTATPAPSGRSDGNPQGQGAQS